MRIFALIAWSIFLFSHILSSTNAVAANKRKSFPSSEKAYCKASVTSLGDRLSHTLRTLLRSADSDKTIKVFLLIDNPYDIDRNIKSTAKDLDIQFIHAHKRSANGQQYLELQGTSRKLLALLNDIRGMEKSLKRPFIIWAGLRKYPIKNSVTYLLADKEMALHEAKIAEENAAQIQSQEHIPESDSKKTPIFFKLPLKPGETIEQAKSKLEEVKNYAQDLVRIFRVFDQIQNAPHVSQSVQELLDVVHPNLEMGLKIFLNPHETAIPNYLASLAEQQKLRIPHIDKNRNIFTIKASPEEIKNLLTSEAMKEAATKKHVQIIDTTNGEISKVLEKMSVPFREKFLSTSKQEKIEAKLQIETTNEKFKRVLEALINMKSVEILGSHPTYQFETSGYVPGAIYIKANTVVLWRILENFREIGHVTDSSSMFPDEIPAANFKKLDIEVRRRLLMISGEETIFVSLKIGAENKRFTEITSVVNTLAVEILKSVPASDLKSPLINTLHIDVKKHQLLQILKQVPEIEWVYFDSVL